MLKEKQIAAQLYNIRDHLKDPDRIPASLARVREMGYLAVELAGLGPWSAEEWRTALDAAGLTCCSVHIGGDTLLQEPGKAKEILDGLGCRYATYPFPAGTDFGSEEAVRKMLRSLTEAGKLLGENGYTLLYHNHDIEFMTFRGGAWLEHIFAWADPQHLQAELDVFWVQAGGGNPESWCRRLKGRLPILHMKDFGVSGKRERVFREIGRGNLEWEPIVKAAKKAGCRWYVVEQDRDWINSDPFEALKISFDYIKESFCR